MDSSQRPGQASPQQAETRLVTAGRDTRAQKGFVNPPVVHGSTVLYPTAADLHAHSGEYRYGRYGTPTTKAFQETLMALEGPQCAGGPSGQPRRSILVFRAKRCRAGAAQRTTYAAARGALRG